MAENNLSQWTLAWRKRRLPILTLIIVAAGVLVGGSIILIAKWLYTHPSNPAGGAALSLLSDFVPMAIATVGIIMSYRTPKKEHHFLSTIILIIAGLCGTGIMSLTRIRNEAVHKSEMGGLNQKLQSVGIQNTQILNGIVAGKSTTSPPAPQVTEAERRRSILALLRNEYILSHDNLSPALVAGTEQPPADWVNLRLKQLREKWSTAEQEKPKPDVSLRFVYPKEPDLIIINRSDSIARDIKWGAAIWNMDLPDRNDPLPIPTSTFDWLRPHTEGGPQALFGTTLVASLLKPGNRLLGSVSIGCPECPRGRTFIVYIVWAEGGWFSEIESERSGDLYVPVNGSKDGREMYFKRIEAIPERSRISIGQR